MLANSRFFDNMWPEINKKEVFMNKFMAILLTLMVAFSPTLSVFTAPTYAEGAEASETASEAPPGTMNATDTNSQIRAAKKKAKNTQCKAGYFRNPATNRCKKLVTVSETASTITTTTYNAKTGKATVQKTCKAGYWWNKKTSRCNKKKTCAIGYAWQSSNNTCKKIVCQFGFKVQDASNICKRIVCDPGHIINQKTGNCIINRHGKYKECPAGWTLDLMTLECALIGTKGSNDPVSQAAAKNLKKSANVVKTYAAISSITLASETTSADDSGGGGGTSEKTCPEGKFLNPKTNRCKNLQTISETSTGKTITTYDPETGEATTVKICNDGYYLNEDTNRCNKVKEDTTSTKSTKSSSSSSKTTTKTCPEGKFLNPKTNRCKNLQTITESSTGKTITTYDPKTGEATTEKICNDGYELNPETNRCKKKKENSGASDSFAVPELGGEEKTNFVAIGSVAAIAVVGLGFVGFQFRHEIAKFFKKFAPRKKS